MDNSNETSKLVGDREMEGYVENQAFCGAKGSYKVYFVIRSRRISPSILGRSKGRRTTIPER